MNKNNDFNINNFNNEQFVNNSFINQSQHGNGDENLHYGNNMINNPKKKNINIGLYFATIMVPLIVVTMLVIFPKDSDNKKNGSNNKILNVEQPQYENGLLEVVDDLESDIQGKIVDVVSTGIVSYYVTSDNKVYTHNVYDYKYFITLDSKFKKVSNDLICGGDLTVLNDDNTYTVYNYPDPNTNFTFSDENLVCAYIDYGVLSTFSLVDNTLYYSWYEETDSGLKPHKNIAIINEKKRRII